MSLKTTGEYVFWIVGIIVFVLLGWSVMFSVDGVPLGKYLFELLVK